MNVGLVRTARRLPGGTAQELRSAPVGNCDGQIDQYAARVVAGARPACETPAPTMIFWRRRSLHRECASDPAARSGSEALCPTWSRGSFSGHTQGSPSATGGHTALRRRGEVSMQRLVDFDPSNRSLPDPPATGFGSRATRAEEPEHDDADAREQEEGAHPQRAQQRGTYRASSPLTNQPKNTAMPIARPRISSGKISASHTQTAMLRKDCIDSTNKVIKTRDHERADRGPLRDDEQEGDTRRGSGRSWSGTTR